MPSLACFVSAHGFGHAARVAAVVDSLCRRVPGLEVHLFTAAPPWFFEDSCPGVWTHHPGDTDVGLVQRTSLEEDGAATADRLDGFLPFPDRRLDELAAVLARHGCRAVLCDISPLGIAVARRAGLPSFLVENFTWDWIYRAYAEGEPRLAAHADRLAEIFGQADHRIQVEPPCRLRPDALQAPPVARRPRLGRDAVRDALAIPGDWPLVLVTMGGFPWTYRFLARLRGHRASFVVPGGGPRAESREGVTILPERSAHYHPDLVAAADVVVGKLGYSTLAETAAAGGRLLFVPRPRFPESPVLAAWARRMLTAEELRPGVFAAGEWLGTLDRLLGEPPAAAVRADGAERVAQLLAAGLETRAHDRADGG